MNKLDVAEISLKNAATWQAKGEPVGAQGCLSLALMSYLAVAAEGQADQAGAAAWLAGRGVGRLLRRLLNLDLLLAGEVDAGRLPAAVLGGNYGPLTFAHLAWALRDFAAGEAFAALAGRPDVLGLSTPFWREYASGVGALVRGWPYEVWRPGVRGPERYWLPYLRLIEAATRGRDVGEAVAAVEEAFRRRNLDRGLRDDSYRTEGSGEHPTRWDYRRDGLLSYIGRGRR
jgi:hypothetical protein